MPFACLPFRRIRRNSLSVVDAPHRGRFLGVVIAVFGFLAGCEGRVTNGPADGANAAEGNGATTADGVSSACIISASHYDQSCAVDSDCTSVSSGNYCASNTCLCGGSAINVGALAQFNADVAKEPVHLQCPCPMSPSGPCCRSGTCQDGCGASAIGVSGASANGSSAIGPGCLGSPGESCSPYSEGTVCPGPPTVCVPCGPGVYTPSESFCRCTSSTWDCGPPAVGQVQCASPVSNADFYIDPSCSVPYVADAGPDTNHTPNVDGSADAATGADSGTCMISASHYDQACTVDTDCAIVSSGDYCVAGCLCGGSALNVSALGQFNADVSKTPLGSGALGMVVCSCPAEFGACCRQGICQASSGCFSPSDTLPACANAGGTCQPPFVTACNHPGPADACAYSDELCCLN